MVDRSSDLMPLSLFSIRPKTNNIAVQRCIKTDQAERIMIRELLLYKFL